jgi:hypothetical protein
VSKKKHLPEFDPLAGEGPSSPIPIDSVHVPISPSVDVMEEGTVVAEYRLEHIFPDFFQSRGGVLPRSITQKMQEDKIDQREALADWRKLTTKDEAQKKRSAEVEGINTAERFD